MKKTILVICCLLVAAVSFADSSYPIDPLSKAMVQGPSYSGLHSAVLTVNSTNYDMRLYPVFSIYSPTDCRIRAMAASGVKTGTVSEVVIGGQYNTIITHTATPFYNVSGCTGGVLRRQPKNK